MTEAFYKAKLIMDLRNQGVRDRRVLESIERVPREMFLPPELAAEAYADHALPIACGQTISQPFVVAFMTDRMKLDDRMKVLEIGTGSGYQTAILSKLCRRVYTIERYRTLLRAAEERFRELRLANITTLAGDGMKGWPAQAPFERIIVTAAAKEIPEALLEQLAVGGIMIIPVDVSDDRQELKRVTRDEKGYEFESLMPVRFVPLVSGLAREL
ncbi:MAG: protein-L-isoaspartate(D-aspartate) O-methyltransferase [Parvibaculaceae bacterium]